MSRRAVLVLSGGSFQGLAVVRLLAESDAYRIIVGDCYDTGITEPFADDWWRLPRVADEAALVCALIEGCRREDVGLVLPSTDHELELLARARPQLEASGTRVAVCDLSLLGEVRDKLTLAERLVSAGFPVPEAVALDSSEIPYPITGKPRRGWGSRDILVIRGAEDLRNVTAAQRAERVWQRFIDGAEEISADFAVGFDGRPLGVGLRRRVRVAAGFAVISETLEDRAVERLVLRFADWAGRRGGRGLFNVQMLRRGEELVLTDVNPRLGTSAVHWRDSDFNPVTALCTQAGLDGSSNPQPRASRSRRTLRYIEEMIVTPSPASHDLEAVVFDLDDTLIPTKRWMADRLGAALARVAPEADLPRAIFHGRRIIEEGPRPLLIDAVCEAMGWTSAQRDRLVREYSSTWPPHCATYVDVKPALETLKRRGLRLGLLTDNPPQTQRRKLEASGLAALLDAVVYSREIGAEKPDPRCFESIADALGTVPGRTAMAGDNPHRDLAGAARAGYSRLFWVRRQGASCGFDPALAGGLAGAERFEPVADLRALAALLRRR